MSASKDLKPQGTSIEREKAGASVLSRRNAVLGVGAAGALGAAAVVLHQPAAAPAQLADSAAGSAGVSTTAGYRLTEHIQRYYATARI